MVTKNIGCGKDCYWNGFEMVKCGKEHLCKDCTLKKMGIEVGKKFYSISYGYGRWYYEYEILKLNEGSVRIRCTFLDGRQEPQEYSLPKDKIIERFSKYSKTFNGAVSNTIKIGKQQLIKTKKLLEVLPNEIKEIEKELLDLKKLNIKNIPKFKR